MRDQLTMNRSISTALRTGASAAAVVAALASGPAAAGSVADFYKGKVVKVVDFGAFVNFMGARDGLCHISELAPHRVKTVTDICNEGDQVYVKCLAIDDRGKVRLSMKTVDQKTGKENAVEDAVGD